MRVMSSSTPCARASFNPRPPILAGDASTPLPLATPASSFNPRPPILAGDAAELIGAGVAWPVSIHARQYWRAMRLRTSAVESWCRFQSTPANTGGRCLGTTPCPSSQMEFQSTPANTGGRCHELFKRKFIGVEVSIHARQYWRAMLRSRRRPPPARSSFNPRPPILAGDATCPYAFLSKTCCFNPRPPILAGDAAEQRPAGQHADVSIHARQYWRAMQRRGGLQQTVFEFQSTPANTGGRCRLGAL